MIMKRFSTIICVVFLALTVSAQGRGNNGFSPEHFDAELQKYITKEAGLTQQEAEKFFPLYKEMQQKQRALYGKQRLMGRQKPTDEKGCEQAIKQYDEIDLELKRIQLQYHNKMLKVISASKLYEVIKAESTFHRQQLRNWSFGPKPGFVPKTNFGSKPVRKPKK